MNVAYNMDCMEYMRTLQDKAFDLAVVDPPYGIGEDGGKDRSGYVTQKNGARIYVKDGSYEKTGFDRFPADERYFAELFRVSKNQIIWGANYFALPRGGAIVWDKCNDGADQSGAEIAFNSLNLRTDIFRFMWRGMMQGKSIAEGTVQQVNILYAVTALKCFSHLHHGHKRGVVHVDLAVLGMHLGLHMIRLRRQSCRRDA